MTVLNAFMVMLSGPDLCHGTYCFMESHRNFKTQNCHFKGLCSGYWSLIFNFPWGMNKIPIHLSVSIYFWNVLQESDRGSMSRSVLLVEKQGSLCLVLTGQEHVLSAVMAVHMSLHMCVCKCLDFNVCLGSGYECGICVYVFDTCTVCVCGPVCVCLSV